MAGKTNTNPLLPEWMLTANPPNTEKQGHRKLHFLRNTLSHLSEIMENEFFSERYADLPLFLQAIDPRIKILLFLVFILISSFCSNLAVLLVLAVIPAVYAGLSGLKEKAFLRRIWLYIPVLIFIFSLPGATNWFVQGKLLLRILPAGTLGLKDGLYITANGMENILRISLRAGISLSFALLLLLTTRWSRLMQGLGALRFPHFFLSICNMAYRYIFVLCTEAVNMMEARYLRTVGETNAHDNRRFMGNSVAHLFLKSHYLSGEVYDAMCCRGFTGKPVALRQLKIRRSDLLFLLSNVLILFILILGEYVF